MEPIDTLLAARWIAPVAGDAVLEHHALAVRAGRIVALLPEALALERYAPREHVSRPRHLLTPGLVNAHAHAATTLFRGLGAGLPRERWLERHVRPLERRGVGAEFVRDCAALAIAEQLCAGITCFADLDAYPDAVASVALEFGMRATVGLPVSDEPDAWAPGIDEGLERGLRLHDEYRDHPLIATAFAAQSVSALSDATLARLKVLVDQLEAPFMVHLHETRAEVDACVRRHGATPLARLERLGLANSSLVGVHFVHASHAEIALAGRAGLHVVHCPTANLKLGSGVAALGALRASGVNVCLGTDGVPAAGDLDVLRELRLALLLAAGASGANGAATAIEPAAALRMATLDGARALGLEDAIGTLEPGKWADVACFDLGRLPAAPPGDPLLALVDAGGRDFVSDVWVAGRALVTGHALARADAGEVLARADAWRERVLAAPVSGSGE